MRKHSATCQNGNLNDAHYIPPITELNTTILIK